ncbi:MAG: GtrA family protein [Ruminococcaceae bacterium]|nr:GtrA family protein [Oscillospiraceae bacterium]
MKLKMLYARYKEIINYLIFGVLTTLVDFAVYTPLTVIFGANYKIAGFVPWYIVTSVIAWIAAVLFAYVTNKIWVFEQKDWSARAVVHELIPFAGGRVVTLLIQLFLMWLMIDVTHLDKTGLFTWGAGLVGLEGDIVVKAIVAVVVVVLNYVISKLFVFKKNK